MSSLHGFTEAVKAEIEGEVHTDALRKGIYSTDASIYQIMPLAVLFPRNVSDVKKIVKLAHGHGIPLLPRGGGTSLAGQAVGEAAVLDFTKYMHHALKYSPQERWIRVEPGITRDEVNAIAAKDGLEFAPDPATSSRATIGGMVANNSSGTKSILYGKTSDHVEAISVLLADCTRVDIQTIKNGDDIPAKLQPVYDLVNAHDTEIKRRFPKTMRRVSGYCLDELLLNPDKPQRLFTGSEGTLGIILEATIKLVPLPKCKAAAIVHFEQTIDAVRAVKTMLEHQPAAIEILSDTVLNYSRKNLETRPLCGFLQGDPKAIQIVEFYGSSEREILSRASAMFDALRAQGLGYAYEVYPVGETYHNIWTIRKKGLGLLLGEANDKRGIAFIEDAAIPIDALPEYIEKVLAVCQKHGADVTYYAHASVGVIHVRPILDLRQSSDIEKMKNIADEVFDLVKSYGGAWSGEHGDGLVRSSYLKAYFGDQVYDLFKQVKSYFDPDNIMNPGKIVDAQQIDENLRYGTRYADSDVASAYRYPEQHNFHTAVHQCTGIGACRKMQGGTMCPSYMVTRDDTHSTRGRANALRLAMSGQLPDKSLADPALNEALDLCLSCKACKAECPSSVDMARLKSEVLNLQFRSNGIRLKDKLIANAPAMAKMFSGPLAGVINKLQSTRIFRNVLQHLAGMDKRRIVPAYARQSFEGWFRQNYRDKHNRSVVLFADTYLNFHEPQIGIAAVQLIQRHGWDVKLAGGCCQRPAISHGMLDKAKKSAVSTCQSLVGTNGPVLVCEPSCASAFTDDLPDLLEDISLGRKLKNQVMPIERWIAEHISQSDIQLNNGTSGILLHGHCHQKALYGTSAIYDILSRTGAKVYEVDSGCCGMAGAFGYEQEHYDISKAIGDRVLFQEIAKYPDALIVASGFSCRHQIAHFTGRKALHWLEVVGSYEI